MTEYGKPIELKMGRFSKSVTLQVFHLGFYIN